MTNAEMLSRIQKLSTRALRRNARAAEETEAHWKGLAAGSLNAKPLCPFCQYMRDRCERCALFVASRDETCGSAYYNWADARDNACERGLKRPLRSKPVRAAARLMLAHVRQVGRLIGKALEGRVR